LRAFIDRIHNGIATLLLGPDESVTVDVPLAWLPKGVKEGTVLWLEPSVDQDDTAAGKARVQELLDELGNAP